MNDRLYRSRDERILTGVAGGVAERFDIDPSLVRVGWVVLAILSGGLFLLVYVVMAFVVPEAPAGWDAASARGSAPGPGALPGWSPPGNADTSARPSDRADWPTNSVALAAVSQAGSGGSGPDAPATGPAAEGSPAAVPGPGEPVGSGAGSAASGGPPTAGPPPGRWPRRERGMGGSLLAGIILVLLGGYFLLRQLVPELELGALWPTVLVIIGIALVIRAFRLTGG